jgi:hypothetical protein
MNKKGQTKIQEMAFVLIAIIIFFAMVALVYFSIRLSSLREDVTIQREQAALETVRKLADIPEFSWAGCSNCIDMDKVVMLKGRDSYKNFWELDYLAIERIYPNRTIGECTSSNYPDCTTISLISNKTGNYGSPVSAFVALCGFDVAYNGVKCDLGKIYASAEAIK